MTRAGTRFPLIMYQHLVDRWWTPMIAIGLILFGVAVSEYLDPIGRHASWRWMPLVILSGLSTLVGIFFLVIRRIAYIQPFPNYLKFVTPFLRFHISYKRIHKASAVEMRALFPANSMSGWMRDILAPLANQTAVILELKGYPMSPIILRMFLSKFFFKDKSPHFVILVKDWMKFSSELDSYRSGGDPNPPVAKRPQRDSILSKLPQK